MEGHLQVELWAAAPRRNRNRRRNGRPENGSGYPQQPQEDYHQVRAQAGKELALAFSCHTGGVSPAEPAEEGLNRKVGSGAHLRLR